MRRPLAIPLAALTAASALALAACSSPDVATPAPAVVHADSPGGDVVAIPADGVEVALEALPGIIERVREQVGVPGIAVSVVHDGRAVFAEGFGVREVGGPDAVDADTVFQIASMSKPIGATVVATQVADGLVAWETPVTDLMPTFALADAWVTDHVTVGDLYSHRSGLPLAAGDDLEDIGYDRGYILGRLAMAPLDDFRISYHYANFGMTAGAEAVATAARTDWATLSEREVYEPLGMTSTSSRHDDFLARENRAAIHARVDGEFQALYERDPDEQAPAGGVSSSVNDLARWMALVLGEGTVDGQEVVAADALTPALNPHVLTGHGGPPQNRPSMYGYGFNVGVDPTGRVQLSHSGAFVLGAATNVRLVPDLGLGIAVLTNAAPVGAAEAIAAEFLDVVAFGETTRDWVAAYAQAMAGYEAPAGDLAGAVAPAEPAPLATLETYAGEYASAYFGTARVVLDGASLVVRLGPDGGYSLPLTHWDGDTFAAVPTGENAPDGSLTSVTFARDGAGPAREMTIAFFDSAGLGTWVR